MDNYSNYDLITEMQFHRESLRGKHPKYNTNIHRKDLVLTPEEKKKLDDLTTPKLNVIL